MPPIHITTLVARGVPTKSSFSLNDDIVEAWAEGFHVGALIILILIVFCNIKSRVWLHKLILLELLLAIWHGTFIFCQDPVYGWYLSATATLLFISYQLHNIISWIKIKRFLPRWGSLLFIGSIIAVQPFWIVETWSNFEYFNGLGNEANIRTRPWEALARDPWWIFTTCRLVWAIKRNYNYKLLALIRDSPRFGIMILCMFFSIVFLITDVVINAAHLSANSGINPYWRLALVFKCASDTIFLDDFKSVLDVIVDTALRKAGGAANGRRRSSPAGAYAHTKEDHLKPDGGPPSNSALANDSSVSDRELNDYHATTSIFGPDPAAGRAMWKKRMFPKRDDSVVRIPKLKIRRDITISTSLQDGVRGNSSESFNSKERFFPKPERTHARDGTEEGKNGSRSELGVPDVIQGTPA